MSTLTLADQTERLATILADFTTHVNALWTFSQAHPLLAELETQARARAQECFTAVLRDALDLQRHAVEDVAQIDAHPCPCGPPWRNKGAQPRTILTCVGPLTFTCTYYYCESCRAGYVFLDAALGLGGEQFSAGVQQAVARLGSELPFRPAAATFAVVSGLTVSARPVERLTEGRGALLEQTKQPEQAQLSAGGRGAAALLTRWQQTAARQRQEAGLWAVALDAAKALFRDGGQDSKAGVVFRAVPQRAGGAAPGGWSGAVAQAQRYIVEGGDRAAAGRRLSAEAWRRGIGPEERVICLGEGAPSNGTQFAEHLPHRVEILDW